MGDRTRSTLGRTRVVLALGTALVLAAMLADTRFVSPDEAAAARPQAFDAAEYAAQAFPQVRAGIEERAVDLAELAPVYLQDPAAAGERYGTDVGSGKFAFPVRASGTVTSADEDFLELRVDGVPERAAVRVAVGTPVNGTPVRDALGSITFSDFSGQTDFQSVSNQFTQLMRSEVVQDLDPSSLSGAQVDVVGACATGGPPDSFVVQPVSITVRS